MENHTMRVLQSLVISVCLGLTIHGAYAQKGSIHLNILPQSLASALEVLARSPSRMRLGVARGYFFTNLDSTLEVVIAEALRRFRDRGVVLVEVDIPDLATLNGRVSFLIGDFEAPRDLQQCWDPGTEHPGWTDQRRPAGWPGA
jgi:Asp-tRNA(Asn)/Glu-tRNA(Gln) amidotransferase A subunit family amidase